MPSEQQNETRQRDSIKRSEPSKVPEGKSPPVKIGIIEKVKITLAIRSILMKKASWKTSLGGIGTILAGVATGIKLYESGDIGGAVMAVVAAVSAGLGLLSARDNDKTSEQAGAK